MLLVMTFFSMKGKKMVKLNKVIMMHREIPSGWMEMIGLRKAPHLGTSDGNRSNSNIRHFKPVQGASLPDFRCPSTLISYNSR